MKPSEKAKAHGLKSLEEVSRALGKNKNGRPIVSQQTLINWRKYKPELFEAVLRGVSCETNCDFGKPPDAA